MVCTCTACLGPPNESKVSSTPRCCAATSKPDHLNTMQIYDRAFRAMQRGRASFARLRPRPLTGATVHNVLDRTFALSAVVAGRSTISASKRRGFSLKVRRSNEHFLEGSVI